MLAVPEEVVLRQEIIFKSERYLDINIKIIMYA
jgi:hypothetical protein